MNMAAYSLVLILIGILTLIFGYIDYKYPEKYLEIFGARLLILFKKETRTRIIKLIGRFFMFLGIALIIFGIASLFQ